MAKKLNVWSSHITEVESQGASQAMLYGAGLRQEDMTKPQVGISSMWWEGNTCNMHLLDLAAKVKEGVEAAGLVGLRFNTIGVSDGISMGTSGMSYSLQSRDLIADSIETVMEAQWYDANVSLPGCDKNMPGCVMAMGRLNRPSIMIYGGTIQHGLWQGQPIDVISAFQSYGELIAGKLSVDDREAILHDACPGAGACGGMYTANTMASAIEALGMSLPFSSSAPAISAAKVEECLQAGEAIRRLLELDLKPRDIMTRDAFENAIVTVVAMGGSTNAVLHLIAMGRSVGVDITIDDFENVSRRVPLLGDFKPSGRFVMADLHEAGGTPAVLKLLLDEGLLRGDCVTVTGKTLAENLQEVESLSDGQEIIRPIRDPLSPVGHLRILRGSLAPDGAVAKITGKEGLSFSGPARVFDSEEEMLGALEQGRIAKGDAIVIRYEGPQGGPGMPEMLTPTSAIVGAGLEKDVALLTDGRFSGGSHGFLIGHITPEAQLGGPIALLCDGDTVTIDAESGSIDASLDGDEWERRQREWRAPALKATRGTLYKYIKNVKSASEGCVTDE